jgi:divalent anion:Na+ symporter, DASS family
MIRILAFAIPLALYGVIEYGITAPRALSKDAWSLFAIFSSTIVALITKPLPTGSLALISLACVTATGTIPIQTALDGFASPVIWLILTVCLLARSIIKVGLSNRIAYTFAKRFGTGKIGLSYCIILTDVLIAPFVLSPTARAAGIMIPVYNSMANFVPDKKESINLKNFLSAVYVQTTCIVGAMFLTGTSGNPLIHKIALAQGISISWMTWCMAAFLPGITCLMLLPYLVKRYFSFSSNVDFKSLAKEKLTDLGSIKVREWIVIMVLIGTLSLWIYGPKWGISQVSSTLIGISILLLTNILTFEEILQEKEAWSIFIWFAVIVMLSQNLQSLGVIGYFSQIFQTFIPQQNWYIGLFTITLVYFYSHYFFAGAISHISSMYAVFLALALGVGAPPLLATLVLAFASSLFMALTPYAGASTALIFSNSSIPIFQWWRVNFIISGINLLIWGTIGVIWWKFLGLW